MQWPYELDHHERIGKTHQTPPQIWCSATDRHYMCRPKSVDDSYTLVCASHTPIAFPFFFFNLIHADVKLPLPPKMLTKKNIIKKTKKFSFLILD